MIQDPLALGYVGDMSQATGVNIAIGVNAYIEESDPFSEYVILIDPSGLSSDDESELEKYSEKSGLTVVESWNDWGHFLRISKLRTVFMSAFSP